MLSFSTRDISNRVVSTTYDQ